MHPNPRKIVPILLLIIFASLAYWYFGIHRAKADNGTLLASGTIETTQIHVSAEPGGRLVTVNVDEGDPVKAGDVLVQFDTALLDAQRAQAEAALSVAQASVKTAQSNVDTLQANADAAQSNAAMAQANVDAAQSALTAAQSAQTAAQAGLDAAEANLALVKAGATDEQIRAVEAQLAQAEANRLATQASLDALTAGARPEEIAAAQARLEWARGEYYSMTVVLGGAQIEDVHAVLTQAEDNLTQAQTRKSELERDTRTPLSALDAAKVAIADAQAAREMATQAYQAVQDASLPFYLQVEAVSKNLASAQQNLSQARARQRVLQADSNMIQEALDAAQSTVDEAQKLVDASKTAYDSLTSGDQAPRLKSAWDEVLAAQTALNAFSRVPGSTVTVETLLHQLAAATALCEAASANLAYIKIGARPEQIQAAQAQVDAAQAQVDTAQAQVDSAKARVDSATSQAEAAKSQAEAAKSQVEAAKSQLEAAQAQVEAAQAAINTLDVQISKLTVIAPADGTVLSRSVQPGEVVGAGVPLLTIGQLNDLTITVYAPEDRYGTISIGETAQVSVDSYPGVTFTARVVHIADKAEFTPRNVQTAEGRRTTVFAIKLAIDNADGKLKPGMPADVKFGK